MQTAFRLALRLVIDKNPINLNYRSDLISSLFTSLTELLTKEDRSRQFDKTLATSITTLFFENDSVISAQQEKFVQRTLFAKYEYQIEGPKKDQVKNLPPHSVSKTPLNNFLAFFKLLSTKNQEAFKKYLTENCEIKSIKTNG